MTDDVPQSINENDILLIDKGLIVLREALWYCEENNVTEIQFSVLKRQCDEALSWITEGKQDDMGGSFNVQLKRFEAKDDPKKRYLKRDRQSSKRSFIIPDIEKIKNLLASKGLIEIEGDEYSLFPPMKRPVIETTPTYIGYSRISDPSDEIKVYRNWKESAMETPVHSTNLWKITITRPNYTVLDLPEEKLQELLEFGKNIASEDESRPFQINLEYRGRSSLVVVEGDTETFSP